MVTEFHFGLANSTKSRVGEILGQILDEFLGEILGEILGECWLSPVGNLGGESCVKSWGKSWGKF